MGDPIHARRRLTGVGVRLGDGIEARGGTHVVTEMPPARNGARAVLAMEESDRVPLVGVRVSYAAPADDLRRDSIAALRNAAAKHALAGVSLAAARLHIALPGGADRAAVMRAVGEWLASVAPGAVAGADVGTGESDLDHIAESLSIRLTDAGDPAEWTARTVREAIQGATAGRRSDATFGQISVLVQGAGAVGTALARQLVEQGGCVFVADLVAERSRRVADETGATIVPPESALKTTCDVLAPCAQPGFIDLAGVSNLRVKAIAGAANSFANERVERAAIAQGVNVVPELISNCGGLLHAAAYIQGWSTERLDSAVRAVRGLTADILERAELSGRSPRDEALLVAAKHT